MEAFAAAGAERLYVGKRGMQKSFKQTQINALLVEMCQQVRHPQHLPCICCGVVMPSCSIRTIDEPSSCHRSLTCAASVAAGTGL